MERFLIVTIICVFFVEGLSVDLSFPENLSIGTATSSYQIEGAWNAGGKGENTWDRFTHAYPEKIEDGSTGDIACDSYYKYGEDVQWVKTLGFDFYRFSISWSRILPNGFANEINEEGLRYYKNLIETLLANNIRPVVTIYHWDHPQILEEIGGWTNELMAEYFTDYARIIFKELGPMVKTFITINEPQVLCTFGYNKGKYAPGKSISNMGHYMCIHNILKAHAKVYHMYNEEFRSEQQGELGLSVPVDGWVWTNDTDPTVVERFFQFSCGWVMHPIYHGDYPEIMKTRIAKISKLENYPFSRLPEFSDEWIESIRGTVDFFGLNHYTSHILSSDPEEKLGKYNTDNGIIQSVNNSWPLGSLVWMRNVPEGFGNLLRKIRDEYNNPTVYVFENGYSDTGELDDYDRINYFHGYLKELISAVKNDGCDVKKYSVWSLIDDFEWGTGYRPKFGLVHVNFSDPERTRTAKLSTAWWQSVAKTRILQKVPVDGTDSQEVDLSFPENFPYGAAAASHQTEGAWNVSDKSENTWDRFTHMYPERIANGSNADIACNSYYKYEEDVQWLKKIGFDFYRFSISWSRVLPNGFANEVSETGLQYYKNFTQELLANGIEPVVTLYHWDHPQILEDLGGWTNELMVEWFADYARIIFEELGPMVKTFITINEPGVFCNLEYNIAIHAPGKVLENMGHYICMHNILKAHATAYHIYDEEFRAEQQGQIGLSTPLSGWVLTNDTDAAVVERFFQFSSGWMNHPIYHGDYPEIMKTRIAMISELENYLFSRLPEFSDEWIQYIKGTADFFGLNHYTSYILTSDPDEEFGIYTRDDGIIQSVNESWSVSTISWIYDVPEGFGNVLREIKDQYNNPPVYVFENGYTDDGNLDDYERINYFYGYLKELLSAVKEDGCNVQRYTAWSLLDSFEWAYGYLIKYGLVHVNFSDPERTRTAKLFTAWWQSVTETRILQEVPISDIDST